MFAARGGVIAKQTPPETTTETTETTTTTQPQTYKTLLAKIKGMKKTDVVDSNNALTPTFITFVQENTTTSDLSGTETEALLQAGFNIHATLSGDQAKDKAALSSLSSQIQDATSEEMDVPDLFGEMPKPLPTPKKPKQLPILPTPKFYDLQTGMMNQAYLTKEAESSLKSTKSAAKTTDIIINQYINKMLREWADRGLVNPVALTKILKEQIKDAVENAAENMFGFTATDVETKTLRFYNDKTNTLDQNVLNAATFEKLQQNIPANTVISSLTKQYQDAILPIWREKNIKDVPAKIKALKKQIADTVQTISKQIASKKAVGGQIVKQEKYESFDNPLFEGNKPNTSYEQLKRRAEKP